MTTAPTVSSSAPLSAIGIVGGGQLAWMLAEAAARLGVALHVQTPSSTDPAAQRATSLIEAAIDDVEATRELARRCGAISFENEWIPLEELASLAQQGVRFIPSLEALWPLVDKRRQRELLDALHLPTLRWCPLESALPAARSSETPDSEDAMGEADSPAQEPQGDAEPMGPRLPEGFSFPVMAKAGSGGYDGRGTRVLQSQGDLESLLEEVDPAGWLLEELVRFEQELALVACRDQQGRLDVFPLVQTHQSRQVCDWVLFPAEVDHAVEIFARNVAASLLTALDYVGVLSIEFFYGPAGLQINELAPRTHNSGHYTIEACRTSQFEQQLRIVSGLPMTSTEPLLTGALMVNLLSPDSPPMADEQEQRLQRLRQLNGAQLHWYGKSGHRPGRKLGHLTIPLQAVDASQRRLESQRWLEQVRAIWPGGSGSGTEEGA